MTDNKVHKDDVHKINWKIHKQFDRYLDAVDADFTLFDPKTMALIQKYVKDNDVTATEKDAQELERKRAAVAAQRMQQKQRNVNKGVEFFDDLVARRKAQGE